MTQYRKRIVVGCLTYNSAEYISLFLDTLLSQTIITKGLMDTNIVLLDNDSTDNTVDMLRSYASQMPLVQVFQCNQNSGFSAGHNTLIRHAIATGADMYACLNIDMMLCEDFLERLILPHTDDTISATGGRVRQWNGTTPLYNWHNKDIHTLDTTGIDRTASSRLYDIGQGKRDTQQNTTQPQKRFGISGTAVVYSIAALKKTAIPKLQNTFPVYTHTPIISPTPLLCTPESAKEMYFDEYIFAYKEDCELAWRMNRAGFSAVYVPEAVAYHDRTTTHKQQSFSDMAVFWQRFTKSRQNRAMSFAHHYYTVWRHWESIKTASEKAQTLWLLFKMGAFAAVFEWESWRAWWRLYTRIQDQEHSEKY